MEGSIDREEEMTQDKTHPGRVCGCSELCQIKEVREGFIVINHMLH